MSTCTNPHHVDRRTIGHQFLDPDTIAGAVTDDDSWAQLPVPVRAITAAVALAATGGRVSKSGLGAVGRFDYRETCRPGKPWRDLVEALVANPLAITRQRLDSDSVPVHRLVELEADKAKLEQRLAEANTELKALRESLRPVQDYAADLAMELTKWREDERAELARRVVDVRPRLTVVGAERGTEEG